MTNPLDSDEWRLELNGVKARLVTQSGVFEGLDGKPAATQEFVIKTTDLQQLAISTFPPPVRIGQLEQIRTTEMPGQPLLRARRITWKAHVDGLPIDPFSVDPSAPAGTYHPLCNIIVEYSAGEEETEDPRTFLEITANSTGEFIHGAPTKAWWKDDSGTTNSLAKKAKTPLIPQTIVVPHTEWTLRWPQISLNFFKTILVKRLRARMAHVNDTEMPILFDAKKQTIMFAGYDYQENYTATGSTLASVERARFITVAMKFVEKHVEDPTPTDNDPDKITIRGHNDFWRPGVGWQYLMRGETIGSLKPTYKLSDLNDLFNTGFGSCIYTWSDPTGAETPSSYQWAIAFINHRQCTGDGKCGPAPPRNELLPLGATKTVPCIPK